MSGKSPNFLPSPRLPNGTPPRNHQVNHRQPLYLSPNSPFMNPRRNQTPSPGGRPSGGSPDFFPLSISSPIERARQNWNRHRGNFSNNSSFSTPPSSNSLNWRRGNYSNNSSFSTPPSSNSGHSYSPYKRRGSRGRFRGRGSFNSSGSESTPIHVYCNKEALEDPWADLEKLENKQGPGAGRKIVDSEETVTLESSGSDRSEDSDDAVDDES